MPNVSMSRRSARSLAVAFAVFTVFMVPAPAAAARHTPDLLGPSELSALRATLGPIFGDHLRAVRRHHHGHGRRAGLSSQGHAIAPGAAPGRLRRLISAANHIAHTPYIWGGGHGSFQAAGYDCSGSVGYALHAAGVLATPATSGALASYGLPGPGRWVTIYANGGHVYMVVAGLRFDTSARDQTGSRWTHEQRSGAGYVVRHPAGL